MAKDFLYCEETDTKIKNNDVVTISTYPNTKWIAKYGWYNEGTAQKKGWYLISIADKSILPIDSVDIKSIAKDGEQGSSSFGASLHDVDAPSNSQYVVIPNTNIRLYDGDIVKISNKPRVKWVVHTGWYIFNNTQNFGWYFECIKNGEILPVSAVDLTLVTLDTVKTQGSEKYDGKVVGYTRPFTLADAELLNRTFITLDTIEQRDTLDINKLINGRIVRINDVDGMPAYYIWDAATKTWKEIEDQGMPEIVGTSAEPVILSKLNPGLYRVKGCYQISPNYETIIMTSIDHIVFVNDNGEIDIKVITDKTITDYTVEDDDVTFINEYATQKYVADNYATIIYVDEKIAVLEAEISEIIAKFHDKVMEIVYEVLNDALDNISESYINNLFN